MSIQAIMNMGTRATRYGTSNSKLNASSKLYQVITLSLVMFSALQSGVTAQNHMLSKLNKTTMVITSAASLSLDGSDASSYSTNSYEYLSSRDSSNDLSDRYSSIYRQQNSTEQALRDQYRSEVEKSYAIAMANSFLNYFFDELEQEGVMNGS